MNQQEYNEYREKINKLGNELGKSILKVLESEKYKDYAYSDAMLMFLIASNYVNENIQIEWLRDNGRIHKFDDIKTSTQVLNDENNL